MLTAQVVWYKSRGAPKFPPFPMSSLHTKWKLLLTPYLLAYKVKMFLKCTHHTWLYTSEIWNHHIIWLIFRNIKRSDLLRINNFIYKLIPFWTRKTIWGLFESWAIWCWSLNYKVDMFLSQSKKVQPTPNWKDPIKNPKTHQTECLPPIQTPKINTMTPQNNNLYDILDTRTS